MKAIPKCLCCGEIELTPIEEPSPEIEFFECPACHRHYARKPGKALTFRWLHPVSLPLYSVLFDADPVPRASQVAELFIEQKSPGELSQIIEEIGFELDHPTQNVRDVLDNPQTEEQCREFLRAFVACVRSRLG